MTPVVNTSSGRLRGVHEEGVLAFHDIPYAQPPIGPLRFRPSLTPVAWEGVREAVAPGPAAMQGPNPVTQTAAPTAMSEDCLYLNVWTPTTDDARRPVLVWLHGGAFMFGAGSDSNGARLAARGDVVVVTLNYRLGLFGFLRGREVCGDKLDSTGSEGLLDQVAALEWIRDEISGFGGDPSNVTVVGQSAGACCTALLTIIPRARGLLHKVIQQSGGYAQLKTLEESGGVMQRVLDGAGLAPTQASQLHDWPAEALIDLQQRVIPRTGGVSYGPVADGELIPTHPFAAEHDGASRGIPLLCGTNLDETKFLRAIDPSVDTLDATGLLSRCRRLLPTAGDAERVIEAYHAARQTRGADITPPELWNAISSDQRFRAPMMWQAELHAAHTSQTYAYLFTWPSPAGDGRMGAAHTVEIPFVFGRLDDPRVGPLTGQGSAVQCLSEQMMDAWIAFARTGNPGTETLPTWPAYTADRRATMVLDEIVSVLEAPLEAERAVWASQW